MDQLPRKPDHTAARLVEGDRFLAEATQHHLMDAAPRPVTSARVSPSRNAHPHPFNDPCNYLGSRTVAVGSRPALDLAHRCEATDEE